MWQALKHAARGLGRTPGFAVLAIGTLAVGIALNAIIFALANAYFLNSLPYPEARRLYELRYTSPDQRFARGFENLDWRPLADIVEHFIAWDLDAFYLLGGERPESLTGAWVTPGFVEGLGIRVERGRSLEAADFQAGAPQVVLISHAVWQEQFGGDPQVLGRRFRAYVSDRPDEAEAFTVVGVLPSSFWHLNRHTAVLAPLRAPSHPYMVRLREGVPPAEAERRIAEVIRPAGGQWKPGLRPAHEAYVSRVRPALVAVAGAAATVLLIACANLAFLLLVRARGRAKEMAIRAALGARAADLGRMLAAEGLLLGGIATLVGLLAASWALTALTPAIQEQLGRTAPGGAALVRVEWKLIGASVLFALLTAVVFALGPFAFLRSATLAPALGRSARSGKRLLFGFVGLQVAGSLALLAGGALMVNSVVRLLGTPFGMNLDGVTLAQVGVRARTYPTPEALAGFSSRLLQRMAGTPGVSAVALADGWAMQQLQPEPLVWAGGQGRSSSRAVSPEYFAALGIPLREGRAFAAAEREPVAIVSASLAAALWPGRSPLGERVKVGDDASAVWRTVTGVASDVRQSADDTDASDVYLPLSQAPSRFVTLYLKGSADLEAEMRRALREIDAEASLGAVRPILELVGEQTARPRFLAWVLAGFSVFAALLALTGVFGVIAYSVRQRTHEIAVRMAVGASGEAVTWLFARQGAAVLAAGLAAGLLGALALGRALESQLFGVKPGDPVTLGLSALAFGLAGFTAAWLAARKAARTDPITALRSE